MSTRLHARVSWRRGIQSVRSPRWRSTLSRPERVVITGMSINTPLGDTIDGFLVGLLAGKSAITRWKTLDVSRCYSKIGADLSEYDVAAKLASLESKLDDTTFRR